MTRDRPPGSTQPGLPLLPERPAPVWPGQPVVLGGRTLFVRRAGPDHPESAESAVFVHGLGGASTNWTDLIFLLRERFDCWAPDLPGFGRSEPPPHDDYGLGAHVGALVALLEHVRARAGGPVHLFGNSLGGAASVRIAATRPDLVRTLTLISPAMPALRPRRDSDPRLLLLLLPGVSRAVARATRRQSAADRVRAVLALCFADPGPVPPQRFAEAVEEMQRRRLLPWYDVALMASLRGLVASYLTRGPDGLWEQASRISAPTLVVWGRQDRLVPVSLAARVHRTIAGSRLVVLDNCAHVAQLEDPVRVAQEFLALV